MKHKVRRLLVVSLLIFMSDSLLLFGKYNHPFKVKLFKCNQHRHATPKKSIHDTRDTHYIIFCHGNTIETYLRFTQWVSRIYHELRSRIVLAKTRIIKPEICSCKRRLTADVFLIHASTYALLCGKIVSFEL